MKPVSQVAYNVFFFSSDFLFQEIVNKAQDELAKQKEVIAAQDSVIKTKCTEVAKYKEQNNDSQLKIKELDHNIKKHKHEAEDAAAKACLS